MSFYPVFTVLYSNLQPHHNVLLEYKGLNINVYLHVFDISFRFIAEILFISYHKIINHFIYPKMMRGQRV